MNVFKCLIDEFSHRRRLLVEKPRFQFETQTESATRQRLNRGEEGNQHVRKLNEGEK